MASEKLKSIDDHERFIDATIKGWSPEQQIVLAAAMAERWLPVYEAFSLRKEWESPSHECRAINDPHGYAEAHPRPHNRVVPTKPVINPVFRDCPTEGDINNV